MTAKIKSIPEGYHTVTPYLIVTNTSKAIEFYKEAFGATESMRLASPDGKVMHAEIKIGDSPIMLCDECPDWNALSPQTIGGTAVSIMLYLEEVDSVVDHAIAAGATLIMPVADQFWGDRMGSITDPFGHKWTIATHVEDVSPEEIDIRSKALFGNAKNGDIMSTRDEYVRKMQAKLEEWNADIDTLSAKAHEVSGEVRREFHDQVTSLKSRQAAAQQKIEELQKDGGSAWEDLKSGIDLAWSAIGESIDSAKSRFKRE